MRPVQGYVKGLSYVLVLLTLAQTGFAQSTAPPTHRQAPPPVYAKLPLGFEPNQGQVRGGADFIARGQGYTLLLEPGATTLAMHRARSARGRERMEPGAAAANTPPVSLTLRWLGANPSAAAAPEDLLPGKSNYFIGRDRGQWRTDIANYGRVRFRGVYPGIDVVYYGNQRLLEHDFEVAPGADPGRIRLAIDGARSAEIAASGDLVLRLSNGEVRLQKPVIYQNTEGGRRQIAGGFVLGKNHEVRIRVAEYDRSRTLVIDPVLAYSTYLGGNAGEEVGYAVATDSSGNAYQVGFTASTNFLSPATRPVSGARTGCGFSTTGCSGGIDDVFIVKINPNGTGGTGGTSLVYSTYLGGNSDDEGYGIAVDSAGNAYVTGYTASSDFPLSTSPAPFQSTLGSGFGNAFVSKLNAAGNTLLYSTYLGGHARDWGNAITQDSSGNIYVAGISYSRDFPVLTDLTPPPAALYVSTNSGAAWTAGSGINSLQIDAIVPDRGTPGTLYAGLVGSGVFKSTDSGANWSPTALSAAYPNALAIDPTTTGASAIVYEADRFQGVVRLSGGGTVTPAFIGNNLPNFNVLSLALDTANNTTLYAGLNGNGVWVGTNASTTTPTWTQVITTGLADRTVNALAIDPLTHIMYAGTNAGVYQLQLPSGGSWSQVAGGPTGTVLSLSIDSGSHVYAASFGGGLYKLSAGVWTTVNGTAGSPLGTLLLRAVAVAPNAPSVIYAGGRIGLYRSADGGSTWAPVNAGLTADSVQSVAVDNSGANVYVGMVNLMSFVAKFNSGGAPTVLSHFGGGSGSTQTFSIAVDNATSQNLFVAGITSSASMPAPLVGQTVFAGNTDGFVAKIGTVSTPSVVWDRYLGGAFDDVIYSLALDSNGNEWVTGYTYSSNFPVTGNAYQGALNGTANTFADAIISEIDPTGANLLYSTYFGGSFDDEGTGIATVQTSGVMNIGVQNPGSGYTSQPTVTISGGGGSGATATAQLSGGTVVGIAVGNGGSGYVQPPTVTITGGGGAGATAQVSAMTPPVTSVSITGDTDSTDLPLANPFQPVNGGSWDTYYAKFEPARGSTAALLFSTYVGGSSFDFGSLNNLALDPLGAAWISGQTFSTNFPTIGSNAVQPAASSTVASTGDAMLYKIATTGNASDVSLSISSTLGTTVGEGQTFSYSISVANNGPGPNGAAAVSVTGTIPNTLTVNGSIATSQGSCAGTGTFTCFLGTLAIGTPVTITVPVLANTVTNPPVGPTLAVFARAWTSDDDPSPANNTATRSITVQRQADLAITNISAPSSTPNHTPFNYNVTFANNGPSTATGVILSYTLPANVLFNAASSTAGCSLAGSVVTCTVGSLSALASSAVVINVTPQAAGPLSGTFTVSSPQVVDNGPGGGPGTNNTATLNNTVNASVNLSIAVTALSSSVPVGGTVPLAITVSNNSDPATGISVSATLPAGMSYVSFSSSRTGVSCTAGSPVQCSLPNMASGDVIGFTILERAALQGSYTTTVSVSSSVADAFPSDNTASATVNVNGGASTSLSTVFSDYEKSTLQVTSFPFAGGGSPVVGGASPSNIVLAPNGRLAFVANVNGSYISVYDLTIQAEITRLRNLSTWSLAMTSDGQKLLSVGGRKDELDIIDIATLAVTRISLDGKIGDVAGADDIGPYAVGVAGHRAYIANIFGGVIAVDFTNLGAPVISQVAGTAALNQMHTGHQIAVTPDGSTVAVFAQPKGGGAAFVYLIDAASNTLTQTVAVAFGSARTIAIPPTSSAPTGVVAFLGYGNGRIYVLDLRSGSPTFRQVLPNPAILPAAVVDMAVSPDGSTVQTVNGIFQGSAGAPSTIYTLNASAILVNPGAALQNAIPQPNTRSVRGIAIGYVQTFASPAAPVVKDVSPSQISNEAAKVVTIFGDNFAPGAMVRIGNLDPLPASFVSPFQVTITVPAGAAVQNGRVIVTLPNASAGALGANLSGGDQFGAALDIQPPAAFAPVHPISVASFGTENLASLFKDSALLPAGPFSPSLAISTDGRYAYSGVAEIDITDLDSGSSLPPITGPATAFADCASTAGNGLAIAPDPQTGKKVLFLVSCDAATESSETLYIVDVDPASGTRHTLLRNIPTTTGDFGGGQGLAVTPDGRFVYAAVFTLTATRLTIFDVQNGTATSIANITTLGADPLQPFIQVTSDGKFLLLSGTGAQTIKVYDISGTVVPGSTATNPLLAGTITGSGAPVSNPPLFYTFQAVGARLFAYASDQRYLQMFNFNPAGNNFSPITSFTMSGSAGNFPGDSMVVTPEGTLLYAAISSEDAAAVLDVSGSTMSLITKMRTAVNPSGLAVSPRGNASADLLAQIDSSATFVGTNTAVVALNQPFTISMQVVNQGPSVATGASMTLTVPPGAVVTSAAAFDGTVNVTCTISTQVVCPVGRFQPTDFLSVHVTLTANAIGTLTFTNTVSGNEFDPNAANNTASLQVQVQNGADLAVTGTTSANPAIAGSPVTFTVRVTNNGPDLATGVTANVYAFALNTPTVFTTTQGSCTTSGACTLGNIASGATVTITATTTFVANDAPQGTVFLFASASAQVADPNSANNFFLLNLPLTNAGGGFQRLLIAERGLGQLHVYNPGAPPSSVYSIATIATPIATALSPNRRLAFVASLNANMISVVDLSIRNEIKRLRGLRAANIAITPDGTRLVAPLFGGDAVAIIDVATLQVLQTVNLNGLVGDTTTVGDINFGGMAMVGSKAYINLQAGTGTNPVVMIDAAAAPAASPVLIDSSKGIVGQSLGTPGFSDIAATPDGQFVLAVRVTPNCNPNCPVQIISTSSNSVTAQLGATSGSPLVNGNSRIAISPVDSSGAYGYLSRGGTLRVIDLHPTVSGSPNPNFGKLITTVAAGSLPFVPAYLSVSSDGNTVYATTNSGATTYDFATVSAPLLLTSPGSALQFQQKVGVAGVRTVISGLMDALPEPAAPKITNIQPELFFTDTATELTITGSGFANNALVKVGNLDPMPVNFVSSTQVKVTVPAGTPAQEATVILTNPNSTGGIGAQWLSAVAPANNFIGGGGVQILSPLSYQPKFDVFAANFGDGTVTPLRQQFGQFVAPAPTGIAFAPDGSEVFAGSLFLPQVVALSPNSSPVNIPYPDANAGPSQGSQQEGLALATNPATGQPVVFAASLTVDLNTLNAGELLNLIDANSSSPSFNTIIDGIGLPDQDSATHGGLAATPDGKYVYESVQNSTGAGSVVVFDVVNRSAAALSAASLGVADYQSKLVVTSDKHWLLMQEPAGSIKVFDISGNPLAPTPASPVSLVPAFTPPGLTPPQLGSFAIAGSHLYAYDSTQNLVEVFNFNPAGGDLSFVKHFIVPGHNAFNYGGLAVTPDEALVYVALPSDDTVVVLDPKITAGGAMVPVTSMVSGTAPGALGISPKRRDTALEDVAIAITHSPEPVAAGSPITFTVTLTDFGPLVAAGDSGGFLINLPADPNLTVVSSSFFSSPFVECSLHGTQLLCGFSNGGPNLGPPPVSVSGNIVLRTTTLGAVTLQGYIEGSNQTYDPNPANNFATDTANVVAVVAADLGVTMTASAATVPPGASFTYTITVSNAGPIATGYTLTDVLPANVTFVSASAGCSQAAGTVTCTNASLGNGQAAIYQVVVTANALGTITNTATVVGVEPDPVSSNNSATAVVQVAAADLAITKTADLPQVVPGANLTYTITVTNNGPSTSTGFTVTDRLPAILTFVSATAGCAFNTGVVTCSGANLASGGNVTYTVVVTPNTVGAISNTATVAGNEPDPVSGNNSATANSIAIAADLAVTKTASAPVVAPGSNITYTISVTNHGPSDSTGYTLTDVLPANVTFVSVTPGCSQAAGTVTCPGAGLASGASAIYQLVVTANSLGTVSNTATVTGNELDPVLNNNSATATVRVAAADLAITKTAAPQQVAPGANLTFTITVANNGPSTSTGFTVTDPLPANTNFVSATAGCAFSAGVVTCTGANLPSSQNAVYTIVVTPTAVGAISNTATVAGNEPDPVPGNNSANAGATAIAADLGVSMTAAPTIIAPSSNLTYTITVTNNGPSASTGYTLTDTLPANVTFVSAGPGCSMASGIVTCPSAGLGAGQSAIYTVVVLTPNNVSAITNSVSVAGNEPDPVSANNTFTLQSFAVAADLAITAAGANPVGGNAAFNATVTNNGPSDATGVVVTATLDRYTFVNAFAGNGGQCTFSAPVLTCNIGALANGANVVITVVVIGPNQGWAAIVFHAIAAQPDPNPANNAARIGPSPDSFNTPVGNNITVNLADAADNLTAAVNFSTVTRTGTTAISPTTAATLPAGFRAGRQLTVFDIGSNADYAGAINLGIQFAAGNFRHPAQVRLFHFDHGVWVDSTTGLTAGTVSGRVASLSPFAILEPLNNVPVANGGGDRAVPGTMPAGARVTLDGSASSDADGDALTYRWSGPFPEGGGTVSGVNPAVTLPLGVSKITLVVNDGEVDSPAVAMNVAVADFQMSAPAASVPLTRGQSTTFTITTSPVYGAFAAPVSLACSSASADVRCSLSSSSVTPGAAGTTATLTVTAVTAIAQAPSAPARLALWLATLPAFGIVVLGAGRRRKHMAVLLVLVLALVVLYVGCGGGGMSQTQSSSQSTPSSKAVVVTVTGSSGSLQHNAMVTVTIPQ